MEIADIYAALKGLAEEMGPKAELSISVGSHGSTYGFCRPRGYGKPDDYTVRGETHEEVIANMRTEWAKRSAVAGEQTIREMAIAIVRITYDTGSCSDAQLRGDGFDASDVLRFGEQAVERANEMGSSGPFRLILVAGGNALATYRFAGPPTTLPLPLPMRKAEHV